MRSAAEQIKERLDIVETIGSYIKLEKSGVNYKAKCPFHNERTASFFVSPNRQNFYCFGCQASGDIFTFIEKFEGLDFKGALKLLAQKAGITISKTENKDDQKITDRLFSILEKATIFFEDNLEKNNEAKKYLESRGVKEDTIKKWRIGFVENGWRNLCNHLENMGFSKQEMILAGLIKKVPSEEKYYDTFRSRIMFPIFDSAGRVIAFSGRLLGENDKVPKYLNSPETSLFRKSEVLYGFHIAKKNIRKLDYTIIVEGQMDLILSHQVGVLNTVASSGTSITEEHLKKIQKLSNRIIISYDSDNAGEKAAMRAAEIAMSIGMEVKITNLKEGEDPASIVLRDPEEWKEALRKSKDAIEFALEKATRDKKGITIMKEIRNTVLPLLSKIKSEIEKSHFVRLIADRTNIKEESIWADLKNTNVILEKIIEDETQDASNNPESMLIGLILAKSEEKKQELIDKYSSIIGKDIALEKIKEKESNIESAIFLSEKYIGEQDRDKVIEELLNRIELEKLKGIIKEKTLKLDKAKEDEIERMKNEIKKISERIRELSNYI